MTEIDDRIRGALDDDDRAFLESLDHEKSIFYQFGTSFHGHNRWIMVVVNILVLIASGLGVYAVWNFVQADDTNSMLRWAAFGWAAWTVQIALKQWLWDRINMLGLLREIKRLQLILTDKG